MTRQVLIESIINDLSENYRDDKQVLNDILEDVIANALFISNRKDTTDNINLLSNEIKTAVKSIYLQRGTEGSKSKSEMGTSDTFENPLEVMRKNIVNNGKRKVF